MINFLHRVSDTIDRVFSGVRSESFSCLKTLCLGNHIKICLYKDGSIANIFVIKITKDQKSHERVYQHNNQLILFIANLTSTDRKKNKVFNEKTLQKSFDKSKKVISILQNYLDIQGVHQGLLSRFSYAIKNSTEIINQIKDKLRSQGYDDDLDKYASLLFDNNDKTIYNNNSYKILNDAVIKNKLRYEGNEGSDIFGNLGIINKNAIPTIKKIDKGISFFCRDKGTPANNIYGKSSVETCPLTVQSMLKMQETFFDLVSGPNSHITSTTKYINDIPHIIIVCPVGFRDETPKAIPLNENLMKLLGFSFKKEEKTEENKTEISFSTFKTESKQVLSSILGLSINHPDAKYEIIVVKKIMKASITIITEIQLSVSANKLVEQMKKWIDIVFSKDLPRPYLYTRFNGEFDLKPASISDIVNIRWNMNAGIQNDSYKENCITEDFSSSRISFGDSLNLFLFDDEVVARKIIDRIGNYHCHLMIDIGNRRIKKSFDDSVKLHMYDKRKNVHLLPAIISICLSKMGKNMIDIKSNPAFLLGKYCGLSSKAQIQYHLGNNYSDLSKVPSKLIGEQFASSFLRGTDIQRNFANMEQRALPFINALQRNCIGIKTDNIPFKNLPKQVQILMRIKNVNKNLLLSGIPCKFSNEQRAIFSLGYMSV